MVFFGEGVVAAEAAEDGVVLAGGLVVEVEAVGAVEFFVAEEPALIVGEVRAVHRQAEGVVVDGLVDGDSGLSGGGGCDGHIKAVVAEMVAHRLIASASQSRSNGNHHEDCSQADISVDVGQLVGVLLLRQFDFHVFNSFSLNLF